MDVATEASKSVDTRLQVEVVSGSDEAIRIGVSDEEKQEHVRIIVAGALGLMWWIETYLADSLDDLPLAMKQENRGVKLLRASMAEIKRSIGELFEIEVKEDKACESSGCGRTVTMAGEDGSAS